MNVEVPNDVVQWRVESRADGVDKIHMARGDGSYECWYLLKHGEVYKPTHLIERQEMGWDAKTVFITEEL
jgi:hypothetical protein